MHQAKTEYYKYFEVCKTKLGIQYTMVKRHIYLKFLLICIGGLHYSHGRVGCVRARSSSDQTAQSSSRNKIMKGTE
jgi:hypothetical protein